jgi:hypothetical protein
MFEMAKPDGIHWSISNKLNKFVQLPHRLRRHVMLDLAGI